MSSTLTISTDIKRCLNPHGTNYKLCQGYDTAITWERFVN